MNEFKQAVEQGYLRVKGDNERSCNLRVGWKHHCNKHNLLQVVVCDKREYSYLSCDTWATDYNFSELGIERTSKFLTEYNLPKWKLKKSGSWINGAVGPCVFGLPEEDADHLAREILNIWEKDGSRVQVSGSLKG
jgi:hypothetical protein